MQKPMVKYTDEFIPDQFYTGRIAKEYDALEESVPAHMKGVLKTLLDAAYLQGHLDGIDYALWAYKKIK